MASSLSPKLLSSKVQPDIGHLDYDEIMKSPSSSFLVVYEDVPQDIQATWDAIRSCCQEYELKMTMSQLDNILVETGGAVSQHQQQQLLETLVLIRERTSGTLLHIACSYSVPPNIIRRLLDADKHNVTIYSRNFDGAVPLHNVCDAMFVTPPVEVVQMLLDADEHHQTIYAKTDQDDLPIHYAVWRLQPLEVIQLLMAHDHDAKCVTSMNTHGRVPIQTACHRNAPSDVIQYLLDFRKNDPEYVWGALLVISESMGEIVSTSRELQDIINDKSTQRLPVAILAADFYAHCILIASFLRLCDSFLRLDDLVSSGSQQQQGATASLTLVYLTTGYFLLRELLQVGSMRGKYFRDGWNCLDVAKIGTVVASCIIMVNHASDDKEVKNQDWIRNLLVCTGALTFIGLISYLRTTFLPFAKFVNGVQQIFYKLIPFFVMSLLILGAFSFMYFVREFDRDLCSSESVCSTDNGICFCSFWNAFPGVFIFIIRGLDGAATSIDYIFGVVVAIVLLNVLIAIVNNEWNDSSESVSGVFWNYRLAYLAEIELLHGLSCERQRSSVSLFDKLERFGWVEKREHGLLYYRMDYQWTDGTSRDRLELVFLFIPVYYTLFVLGFVSFGLLWPEEIRRTLLAQRPSKSSTQKRTEALSALIQGRNEATESSSVTYHQVMIRDSVNREVDGLSRVQDLTSQLEETLQTLDASTMVNAKMILIRISSILEERAKDMNDLIRHFD